MDETVFDAVVIGSGFGGSCSRSKTDRHFLDSVRNWARTSVGMATISPSRCSAKRKRMVSSDHV